MGLLFIRGSTIALAAVVVTSLSLAASCGDDDADATPSPTISSLSPSPTSTTGLLDLDPPAQTLVVGEPAKLAGTYALIMETGCTQCDGSTSGINRFYMDGRGNYQTEHLYSAGFHFYRSGADIRSEETYRVGLAAAGEAPAGSLYITGFAVSRDGYRMAVSSCVSGTCTDGGMIRPGDDAETVVHYSSDGGVTWDEMARIQDNVRVLAVLDDGRVVIAIYPPAGDNTSGITFKTLPDDTVLTPPQTASPFIQPVALPGALGWYGRGGTIMDSAGNSLFELPPGGPHNLTSIAFLNDKGEDKAVASWQANAEGLPTYLTEFSADGTPIAHYRSPVFLQTGAWISSSQVIVSMAATADLIDDPAFSDDGFTVIPAIVDLNQGVIHPILTPFLDDGAEFGRNHIVAVERGPFVRINIDESTACANVHEQPPGSAPVIECFSNGTLLFDLYHGSNVIATPIDDWYEVLTPSGDHGYVSMSLAEAEPIITAVP